MRKAILFAAFVVPLVVASRAGADEKSGLDAEGFVQKWLVLAPIKMADNESGADALGKSQVKDEGKLKPTAGDKVKVGDKEIAWKAHTCKEHLLDFNELLGGQVEDAVGYAVTFIDCTEEMKGIKMKTGSDDQCKVYLNGAEVLKYAEPRPAEKDQDTTEVTLKKGINILVVKVVNEKVDFSFCVRFTNKDDKPITNLKAMTKE